MGIGLPVLSTYYLGAEHRDEMGAAFTVDPSSPSSFLRPLPQASCHHTLGVCLGGGEGPLNYPHGGRPSFHPPGQVPESVPDMHLLHPDPHTKSLQIVGEPEGGCPALSISRQSLGCPGHPAGLVQEPWKACFHPDEQ